MFRGVDSINGMPDTIPTKEGDEDTMDNPNQDTDTIDSNPYKKRKVALFLMYVGHGYQGMQRNPDCKTIEDDLFKAIYKAGGISDANSDEKGFQKIHWSRAARTDKGVSAMCQVVSLMMVLHPPGIVDRIHENLPDQIRILGYQRVVRGFDARKACDKRRYEYIFPAWVFDPAVKSVENEGSTGVTTLPTSKQKESMSTQLKHYERRSLSTRDPNFVFDDDCTAKMTAILKQFEGTHNFHNYTVRVDSGSPQAKRFILEFSCQGVFKIGNESWVKLVVVGQSFMLHQIRKMVGMAVAEFKGIAPEGSLVYALKSKQRIVVPMAPDLGLFLDKCYYEAYNQKWGDVHGSLDGDTYADTVQNFKAKNLYPSLAQRDRDENVNIDWLQNINEASYKFSQWKSGKATGAATKKHGKRKQDAMANKMDEQPKQKPNKLSLHLSAEYSD